MAVGGQRCVVAVTPRIERMRGLSRGSSCHNVSAANVAQIYGNALRVVSLAVVEIGFSGGKEVADELTKYPWTRQVTRTCICSSVSLTHGLGTIWPRLFVAVCSPRFGACLHPCCGGMGRWSRHSGAFYPAHGTSLSPSHGSFGPWKIFAGGLSTPHRPHGPNQTSIHVTWDFDTSHVVDSALLFASARSRVFIA